MASMQAGKKTKNGTSKTIFLFLVGKFRTDFVTNER